MTADPLDVVKVIEEIGRAAQRPIACESLLGGVGRQVTAAVGIGTRRKTPVDGRLLFQHTRRNGKRRSDDCKKYQTHQTLGVVIVVAIDGHEKVAVVVIMVMMVIVMAVVIIIIVVFVFLLFLVLLLRFPPDLAA